MLMIVSVACCSIIAAVDFTQKNEAQQLTKKCDYTDKPKTPVEAMLLNEQIVRESVIAHEEVNKLREKVQECYWREGVNHLENW